MKIILVGYPGSQHIVPASKYLTNKYLPEFDVTYLNYTGEINDWAKFVADYLETIEDDKIIFALDDYLVAGQMDMDIFDDLEDRLLTCAKLCHATNQENNEYPVTTQYTLWYRPVLIDCLRSINTPWEFEAIKLGGTEIFGNALPYYTNSCLSKRWNGIDLTGLSEEDRKEVEKLI